MERNEDMSVDDRERPLVDSNHDMATEITPFETIFTRYYPLIYLLSYLIDHHYVVGKSRRLKITNPAMPQMRPMTMSTIGYQPVMLWVASASKLCV